MKKIVPILLIIGLLALAAGYFIYRGAAHKPRAAELVPRETIFFAQLPDLRGTAQRFTQTELYKLGQEPELQAFLERARLKAPQSPEIQATIERLRRVSPREAFFALVSIDGPTPQFIGGFSFRGNRRAAEDLLNQPRNALKKSRPAGKADLITYGATEIEIFTDKELTFAQAFRGEWCFIATDLQLLERTLDRYERRAHTGEASLANSDIFKRTLERLPAQREVLLFAQLGKLTDRLLALLTAAGQPAMKEVQELKKLQAVGAATQFDGGQLRDTIFALAPGAAKEPPLTRDSLAFSSPATLVYYATALPLKIELPESATAVLAMVTPAFDAFNKALAEKALSLADLGVAFGPEMGMLVEWPQQTMQPSFVLALDVREAGKAKAFVEVLTGGVLGSPAWARNEQDGITFYELAQQGVGLTAPTLPLTAPALALSNKFLVAGLSRGAITEALARVQSGDAKLGGTAAFRAADESVKPATRAYGYVDLRGLFERVYGTFRPLLAMSLAFMPDAAQYIDASKLPSTEVISKHLGPIVYSQSTSPEGVLVESAGTITLNQALVGVLAGSLSAALPAWTGASGDGGFDAAKLFGLPKLPIPAPPSLKDATPTPAESAPAPPTSPEPTPAEPARSQIPSVPADPRPREKPSE